MRSDVTGGSVFLDCFLVAATIHSSSVMVVIDRFLNIPSRRDSSPGLSVTFLVIIAWVMNPLITSDMCCPVSSATDFMNSYCSWVRLRENCLSLLRFFLDLHGGGGGGGGAVGVGDLGRGGTSSFIWTLPVDVVEEPRLSKYLSLDALVLSVVVFHHP